MLTFGNQTDLFINQLNFINSNYFKFNKLIELINFLKLIVKLRKYEYILFSPGGESFDSFKNYIDRGNHFNRLIKKAIILKNILFRDDKSLLGSNWYILSKKLFIIPFILSFIGILAIYSLIGTEYSILLILKHIIFLFISLSVLIFYHYCLKMI